MSIAVYGHEGAPLVKDDTTYLASPFPDRALLAALITLAPSSIHAAYASNSLTDQQVAGLLMWLPAGLFYLGASIGSLAWRHRARA